MRITDEPNVTLWTPLRPEDPAVAAHRRRADEAGAAARVRGLDVLDTDRDGWLDEDDLPYDQLRLLERARASEPVEEPAAEPTAEPSRPARETVAAAPLPAQPPPVQPPRAAPAELAPHIDLLA